MTQREDTVSAAHAVELLRFGFSDDAVAYESYSELEAPVLRFSEPDALIHHVATLRESGRQGFSFAFHYPQAGGGASVRTIELIPEKCNGATWRQTTEGWGLIELSVAFAAEGSAKCRVAANTEKRAHAWAETLSRLGQPEAWNWPVVERHVRRLIRKLRGGA